MKRIQKITRVKLDVIRNNDLILIGLVSAEPDYKLSLSINKKLRVSLKSTSPVLITEDNEKELTFSRFSDTSSAPDLLFNLITNRSSKNFLIKKLNNIDFIFQIQDSESAVNSNEIADSLREIESVNAVFILDISAFKDKNLFHLTQ
jgi:hypothetical protein